MAEFPEGSVLLEHAGFVRRLAHQLAGPAHADDLQQEAFARAAHRPPGRNDNLRGWFGTVVANIWRNQRREAARRSAREAAVAAPQEVPGVDEIVIREECRRRVVAAVLALPQPLRDVVLLRFYEGLDSPAIGRRIGRPASTVRTQLQQACERLRDRLDADHGGRRQAWVGPLLAWSQHLQIGSAVPPAPRLAAHFAIAAFVVVALVVVVGVWPDGPQQSVAVDASVGAAPAVASMPSALSPPERAVVEAAVGSPSAATALAPALVGALRVRVSDYDTARPVADATVRLTAVAIASSSLAVLPEEPGGATERAADADGIGVFPELRVGTYDVEAVAADGRCVRRRVSIGRSERHLELEVSRRPFRGVVAVKVVDPDGRPMIDAAVELACVCTRRGLLGTAAQPPIAGRTDGRGLFLLRDAERVEILSEGLVLARAVDGRVGCRAIPRPEHRGDNPWFEVTVGALGAIAGRLSGPRQDWQGVEVVAMAAWTYGSVRPQCMVGNFPLHVAADGALSGRDLPAGRYHLSITGAAGLGDPRCAEVSSWQFLPMVTVPAGGVAQAEIELTPQSLVRGQVLDEAGAPLAGVEVCALKVPGDGPAVLWHPSAEDPPSPATTVSARTDANGRYEVAVWPGRWHIAATASGRHVDVRPVDVAAGATLAPLDHRLVVAGGMRGRVATDYTALRLVGAGPGSEVVHSVTTAEGWFALSGLRPGTWEVGTFDEQFRPTTAVEVVAGQTAWVDTAETARCRARGVLQHAGQPLPGIEIGVGGDCAPVVTDALGGFELSSPSAAGNELMRFSHRGLGIGNRPLADGELGVIDLPLRRLDLEVVGQDGAAVAATVELLDLGSHDRVKMHQFLPDGMLVGQWAAAGHELHLVVKYGDGGRMQQRIPAGADPVRLRLLALPCATLAVRLLDGHGAPRVAASMAAVAWGRSTPAPSDGATFWRERSTADGEWAIRYPAYVRTDADGCARFEGLPPGPVLVWFAGEWSRFGYEDNSLREGMPPVEHIGTVHPGQSHILELALPR